MSSPNPPINVRYRWTMEELNRAGYREEAHYMSRRYLAATTVERMEAVLEEYRHAYLTPAAIVAGFRHTPCDIG